MIDLTTAAVPHPKPAPVALELPGLDPWNAMHQAGGLPRSRAASLGGRYQLQLLKS